MVAVATAAVVVAVAVEGVDARVPVVVAAAAVVEVVVAGLDTSKDTCKSARIEWYIYRWYKKKRLTKRCEPMH